MQRVNKTRSILLWLIGVPIPIIILIALFCQGENAKGPGIQSGLFAVANGGRMRAPQT